MDGDTGAQSKVMLLGRRAGGGPAIAVMQVPVPSPGLRPVPWVSSPRRALLEAYRKREKIVFSRYEAYSVAKGHWIGVLILVSVIY